MKNGFSPKSRHNDVKRTRNQCSLKGAQCYFILAHFQHSKFNMVYISHGSLSKQTC